MNSLWLDFSKDKNNFPVFPNENIKTDVCIVGAGIFGLSCAYYLSHLGFQVTVLEKDGIGEKTTGHTTAKITSQHNLFYDYLISSYVKKFATDYLKANEEAIQNIKNIVDTEKIKCDFEYQNSYVYTTKKAELGKIKKEVKAIESLGFPAEFVTKTGLPFEIEGAICFKNQAQFHPLKYLYGLCKSIFAHNGKIYTNTVVTNVEQSKDNCYKVSTTKGNVSAKYVIIASHYPFVNFPRFLFFKDVPINFLFNCCGSQENAF